MLPILNNPDEQIPLNNFVASITCDYFPVKYKWKISLINTSTFEKFELKLKFEHRIVALSLSHKILNHKKINPRSWTKSQLPIPLWLSRKIY